MKPQYSITILNVSLVGAGPAVVYLYWRAENDLNKHFIGVFTTDQNGLFIPPVKVFVPAPGEYIITADTCGCSFDMTMFAAVTQIPEIPQQPGVITGNRTLCPGATAIFSIDEVAGVTGYTWTVPAGWVIQAGQGTAVISVIAGATGQNGVVAVTADAPDGSSTPSILLVAVMAGAPVITGITGPVNTCPAQVISFTAIPTTADSYQWSVPPGWTIQSGQGTNVIQVLTGTPGQNGVVAVTASNLCGADSFSTPVTVQPGVPAAPGVITGQPNQLPGVTGQVFSIAPVADAASYTWTVPAGWIITAGQGTPSVKVTTGANGQNGNIQVTADNACGKSAPAVLPVNVSDAKQWIAADATCAQDGVFNKVKDYIPFSSPLKMYFDDHLQILYVVDYDNAAGNFYKIDPATITTNQHTIVGTLKDEVYSAAVDPIYKRIFAGAKNAGGVVALDIATGTEITLPFGQAVGAGTQFNRDSIDITDTQIICNDAKNTPPVLAFFDRVTLSKIGADKDIGTIDHGTAYFGGNYHLDQVHGKLWASGGIRDIGDIGIYNADLSGTVTPLVVTFGAHVATIIGGWGGNHFWQNSHYDKDYDIFYLGDGGSNCLYIINAATQMVINAIPFLNRGNGTTTANLHKANVVFGFNIDPTTGDLYMSYQGLNSNDPAVDPAPEYRVYKINRANQTITRMYPATTFADLVQVAGTNLLWGCQAGTPKWSGGSWDTDGIITKYTRAGTNANTGMKVVSILQEVYVNSGLPTGNEKNNVATDPDYIAPYQDLANCPITYSSTCPDKVIGTPQAGAISFETDIANAIVNNPGISTIRVQATPDGTAVAAEVVFVPPVNYMSGTLTGLSNAVNYKLKVIYQDAAGAVVTSCLGIENIKPL